MKLIKPEKQITLIIRYLAGDANPDETIELQQWISASNENSDYFQQLKNIWDNSENNLQLKGIDVDKAFIKVRKRITFKSSATNFWYYWKNIAAVVLIPIILGNLLYFLFGPKNHSAPQEPVYNELFAAFGTRSALKLSDGSSVWLNSGSSIRYPDRFIGKNRTVFLNGEAYFEVESNPEKPFIVETSSLKAKATGTKFTVSGYSSEKESSITLVSGKVEVIMTDDKKNIKSSTIGINQHLLFNEASGTSSILNGDPYKYISWKDGKLVFRNDSLSNVVKKISQIFNVDIELRGRSLQDYSYRATFKDESLEEILKLLKISAPIDYIEVKRVPLPDGSFPRKKVIIFPAKRN